MSPGEWEAIKRRLSCAGFTVSLNCDGYRLTVQRQRYSELRDVYTVYVNGVFKHEWAKSDCEERRRFLRPVTLYLWKQAQRQKLGSLSKKTLKAVGVNLDAKMTHHEPFWHSFSALKRHLIKNNNEISLWTESAADDGEPNGSGVPDRR